MYRMGAGHAKMSKRRPLNTHHREEFPEDIYHQSRKERSFTHHFNKFLFGAKIKPGGDLIEESSSAELGFTRRRGGGRKITVARTRRTSDETDDVPRRQTKKADNVDSFNVAVRRMSKKRDDPDDVNTAARRQSKKPDDSDDVNTAARKPTKMVDDSDGYDTTDEDRKSRRRKKSKAKKRRTPNNEICIIPDAHEHQRHDTMVLQDFMDQDFQDHDLCHHDSTTDMGFGGGGGARQSRPNAGVNMLTAFSATRSMKSGMVFNANRNNARHQQHPEANPERNTNSNNRPSASQSDSSTDSLSISSKPVSSSTSDDSFQPCSLQRPCNPVPQQSADSIETSHAGNLHDLAPHRAASSPSLSLSCSASVTSSMSSSGSLDSSASSTSTPSSSSSSSLGRDPAEFEEEHHRPDLLHGPRLHTFRDRDTMISLQIAPDPSFVTNGIRNQNAQKEHPERPLDVQTQPKGAQKQHTERPLDVRAKPEAADHNTQKVHPDRPLDVRAKPEATDHNAQKEHTDRPSDVRAEPKAADETSQGIQHHKKPAECQK